jgi:hypothetical protein
VRHAFLGKIGRADPLCTLRTDRLTRAKTTGQEESAHRVSVSCFCIDVFGSDSIARQTILIYSFLSIQVIDLRIESTNDLDDFWGETRDIDG